MKATLGILMGAVREYTLAPKSSDLVWARKEALREAKVTVTKLDVRRAGLSRETRPD